MQRDYIPAEITSNILRRAGRATIARELSTGLRTASQLDILQSSCQQSITINELNNYLKDSVIFGFVKNTNLGVKLGNEKIFDFDYYVYASNRYSNYTYPNIVSMFYRYVESNDNIYIYNGFINYSEDLKFERIITEYDKILYFDLLTTYRILYLRISCTNISVSYAFNETMRIFDNLIDQWNNSQDIPKLCSYLYINMRVMNIQYHGPPLIEYVPATKDNVDEIMLASFSEYMNFIPSMIANIKNYLEHNA